MVRFPRWLARGVARVDYGMVVPMLARLPAWLARPLSVARGALNWACDFDWRTLSLEHGYVRGATFKAMHAIGMLERMPWPRARAHWWTLRRFVCTSHEEVDSQKLERLMRAGLEHRITGLEHLRPLEGRKTGLILLVAHHDSLYVGLGLLVKACQRTFHLMSSSVIEDPRAHPAVRAHFARKLEALRTMLAPGTVVHAEHNLHGHVRALRRGEVVVIACDVGSTSEDRAASVHFLGSPHLMASGPRFLAQATGAPLALLTCISSRDGMHLDVSQPVSLHDGGLQAAYSRLEHRLRHSPWRWWAADLYPGYPGAPSDRRD